MSDAAQEGAGCPTLGENDVHVWYVSLRECDLQSASPRSLSTRSDLFERRQQERTLGQALIRHTLSRYCPIRPEDWRLILNPHGRPEIDPDQASVPLRFNLSHTTGLMACAVTLKKNIGIDVESASLPPDCGVTELARRYFAPEEAHAVANAPDIQRNDIFLRYWTLKEAFIKAVGQGFAFPLESVTFRMNDPLISICTGEATGIETSTWRFSHSRLPGHHMALAVESPTGVPPRVSHSWTSPCQLDTSAYRPLTA